MEFSFGLNLLQNVSSTVLFSHDEHSVIKLSEINNMTRLASTRNIFMLYDGEMSCSNCSIEIESKLATLNHVKRSTMNAIK